MSNAASGQQAYAPGEIVSVYGTGMGGLVQSAATVPLPDYIAGFEAYINNIQVPLYYVSPNQVNLQIPYEVTAGQTASLIIGNPWENYPADPVNNPYNITIASAAPGIFVFPDTGLINPNSSATRGQTVTLYVTGQGAVTPSVATGDAPSGISAPRPRQTVTVTVGGVVAGTYPGTTNQLPYVGIPSWSVGVLQINYTIPTAASTGKQPVIVTIGTTASPAAYINITQ